MNLAKCKCIKPDTTRGIVEGGEYYVDKDSCYVDCDGDAYAEIYSSSEKRICISLYNKHFIPDYFSGCNKTI